MNYERIIAGAFAGFGGLMSIYLGVSNAMPELTTGGLVLLTGMMAFFVGEKNGARAAASDKEA